MDVRRALALLLLVALTSVPAYAEEMLAGTCEVVNVSQGFERLVVETVYDDNAYNPFEQIVVPEVKEAGHVERNELVLIDPATESVYEVELPTTATPPTYSPISNTYSEGPFAVTLLIDDTLRIAYPDGYANGPYLKERFEGRFEAASVPEAVGKVVSTTAKTLVSPLTGTKGFLGKEDPIRNRLAAEGFTVDIVCASSACQRELYSLLTKLMNIGASSEMALEMGLSVFGGHILGFSTKLKNVTGAAAETGPGQRIIARVKGKLPEERINKFVEEVRKLRSKLVTSSLEKYSQLPDKEKAMIQEMLVDPSKAPILFQKLSPEGRRAAYGILTLPADTAITLKELREAVYNGDRQAIEAAIKKVDEQWSLLQKLSSIIPEEGTEVTPVLKSFVNSWGTLKETLKGSNLTQALEQITTFENKFRDYSNVLELVKKYVPIVSSQYDYIKHWLYSRTGVEGTLSPGAISVLSRTVFAPAAFYFVRGAPKFLGESVIVSDVSETLAGMFPLRPAFKLPETWTHISLVPLRDGDAVIDILVNGGSDPGDIFKSVLRLTGVGLINHFFKRLTGHELPDFLVLSEEKARMYSMKEAVLVLATPETCSGCSLTITEEGVSIESSASLFLSLTENSRPDEGSVLIAFFKKADMYANGEKVLNMKDGENACVRKCKLLDGIGPLFEGNPVAGMFAASLFVGYVIPTFLGPVSSVFIAYPFLSMTVYGGCFSCVDTTFGYYLHVFAPVIDSNTSFEENLIDSSLSMLKDLGIDINLDSVVVQVKKQRIEKRQVVLYSRLLNATGFLTGQIVSQWSRPVRSVPTSVREVPVVLQGPENNLVLDQQTLTVQAEETVASEMGLGSGLAVPDTQIPGFIFPTIVVKTVPAEGDTIIFEAWGDGSYVFRGSVGLCLSEILPELGRVKSVITDRGVARLSEDGVLVQADDWSGPVTYLAIFSDFDVRVRDTDIEVGVDENGEPRVVEKREDVEVSIGGLRSIVFENGSAVRVGNVLYVWKRVEASVPAEAVAGVNLLPEENGIEFRIVPSLEATFEEAEALEEMSERLDNVSAIEATRKAVAIVEDPVTGEKYLRIYHKERNEIVNEKIVKIEEDPEDPGGVRIVTETPEGEVKTHRVKVEVTSDGTPVLKVDGENGGIVKTVQSGDGFFFFDPETGEWQLINGVLAPLAEAFKNGIKMSFEGGMGVGAPGGGIVINTVPPAKQMSLPLFEGWETVVLIAVLTALYVLIR